MLLIFSIYKNQILKKIFATIFIFFNISFFMVGLNQTIKLNLNFMLIAAKIKKKLSHSYNSSD